MAEGTKCQTCGQPATVHLTQIQQGKVLKVDLCEACAQAKGVTESEGFSLAELLAKGAMVEETETRAPQCEQCGMTAPDFKRTGRLGCPACYGSFRHILAPMLSGMHKGNAHTGKRPARMMERADRARRAEELERSLQEAIRDERFEEAARLRDEIRRLRAAAFAPAASGGRLAP